MSTIVGLAELDLHLPGVTSLKEKRGVLKSMLKRIQNTFNVAVAEVDHMDKWQTATIALASVSNSQVQAHKVLQNVVRWVEENYPDVYVTHQTTEML